MNHCLICGREVPVEWTAQHMHQQVYKEVKMGDNNALSTVISSKAEKLFYGLRLNRLSARQRKLQKYEVVDGQGYLTALGVRIYLDYLWQKDKEAQKSIVLELDKLKKSDIKVDDEDED